MRFVKAARATGSGHLVWPHDTDAESVPADFVIVLDHGIRILEWMENLPDDEMPEKWKWHLDWEIESHFENVKEMRKKKYDIKGGAAEAEHMEENALAARFKR